MAAHLIPGFITYLLLLMSLSVHEWAHAYTAHKFGDPTPATFGRLTLNPLAHIDLIGTVIIPLCMLLFTPGFVLFGWAKPVPIDPRYFKEHGKLCELVVGLAGPLSNLILAVLATMVWVCSTKYSLGNIGPLFGAFAWLNVALFVFNLIPLPPLDGGYIVKVVFYLSDRIFFQLSQWGLLILIILANIPQFHEIIFACMNWTMGLIRTLACFLFEPQSAVLLFQVI
ncbi:MAG: site-2 protease family protein [Puniceicoccales bacterium]|jgi:Zn-dependent protease|nr:site-2 protease family protein [Puniceicoccales bacterium]